VPKAWSNREKAAIQTTLREQGKKLFEKYGLRKTTVDELVRSAGISKGAFYLFYASKEELYFDILEQLETVYHDTVYEGILRPGASPRQSFRAFLGDIIRIMTTNPIYRQLNSEDYEYLRRKLPEQTLKDHVKSDFDRFASYFETWMQKGWMRRVSPAALNGMMIALFYFTMHREDLGGTDFQGVTDLWIDMLVSYLIPGNTNGEDNG